MGFNSPFKGNTSDVYSTYLNFVDTGGRHLHLTVSEKRMASRKEQK